MDSKKKIAIIASSVLAVLAVAIIIIIFTNRNSQTAKVGKFFTGPAVFIEIPDKMDKKDRSEFELGFFVTKLGKDIYPAASFSISFDPSKLEFLGLEEGNVLILDSDSPTGENLPEWNVDVETSNKTGLINVMYLDISGKDKGFSQDKLYDDDNSLFYLKFKLRGSVREKEMYELSFKDAVFACEDDSKSLSMLSK
ncbi:MAG: hypothetical protein IJM28_01585, partial [Lachnospiraceae bacterium]|nr:hypothetical protein [Lachnospiraceae bacterium]